MNDKNINEKNFNKVTSSVTHWNVRSIQGKFKQIDIFCDKVKPDIFIAIEHGLSMDKLCSFDLNDYVFQHGSW